MSRLGTHQQRKVSKRAFPTADGLLVLYACRNPRLILQVLHRHLKLTTFLVLTTFLGCQLSWYDNSMASKRALAFESRNRSCERGSSSCNSGIEVV